MKMDDLLNLDTQLFYAINPLSKIPVLDTIMEWLSDGRLWWGVAGVLIGFAIAKKRKRLFAFVVLLFISLGISDSVTYYVLKPAFNRMRPCYTVSQYRVFAKGCGSRQGFPSNHAANGMAVAILALLFFRNRFAVATFITALFVGLSRVYLGVHYPGDVLFGFVVGAIVGMSTYVAYLLSKKMGLNQ